MEIYGVCLNRPLRDDEVEHLMHIVSDERREKVRTFRKKEDADRGLIGEALIRAVIRGKFQLSNQQIVFGAQRYGKPFAAGLQAFHFNIAHSGRWIVCAVDDAPVGIDIEEIRPIGLDVAKHFFSRHEYLCLMDKKEEERMDAFYDLWTLKESFVKREGGGLSIPLHTFSIRMDPGRSISLLSQNEEIPCFFHQLHVDPDYKTAVCSASAASSGAMILKPIDELMI